MPLRIVGKEKAIKDLEKAISLIREANDILYRLPVDIHLETEADIEQCMTKHSDSDSQ